LALGGGGPVSPLTQRTAAATYFEEQTMQELLEHFRKFLDAGDESRCYQLTRDEVSMIVAALNPIPVLTFDDIRRQIAQQKAANAG
jgi:hypothetical protein